MEGPTIPWAIKNHFLVTGGISFSHFLYLMSAPSHQWSVSLSLTVWTLLETIQRTLSHKSLYQRFMCNCSCVINSQEMPKHSILQFYLVCQGKNKNSGLDSNIQMTPSYSWDSFLRKTKQLCLCTYHFLCLEFCSFLKHPTNSYSFIRPCSLKPGPVRGLE